MRMTDIKNKIHELIESAYKMGYEDGKNLKYDLGLNDAWECARKIGKTNWITLEKMGFENKDKEKNPSWDVIMEYSASEAIALINKYEKGREKNCSDCKHYVTDGHTTFCSLSKVGGCCVNKDNWTPKQTEQRCKSKMTIDEAVKHAEEVAKEQDKLCKRYDDASGYTRSHNEDIRTTDAKKCAECAEEHRQLAEWLRELKQLKGEE